MKNETDKVKIEELDNLASKFIIGHKRLSKRQKEILYRISKIREQEAKLDARKVRIKNLLEIMYKAYAQNEASMKNE